MLGEWAESTRGLGYNELEKLKIEAERGIMKAPEATGHEEDWWGP